MPKRIWWSLTPLGRVRLALANSENAFNLSKTRVKLEKKLTESESNLTKARAQLKKNLIESGPNLTKTRAQLKKNVIKSASNLTKTRAQFKKNVIKSASNLTKTRAQLKKNLKVLRQSRYAKNPAKDELMPMVLAKLVELALSQYELRKAAKFLEQPELRKATKFLEQPELREATKFLEQLDGINLVGEVRLELRWKLIQVLISQHFIEEVLNQGKIYVANASSPPNKVGELLIWSLKGAKHETARKLAESLDFHFNSNHWVATLQMLCLENEAVNPCLEQICKDLLEIVMAPPKDCPVHLLRAACSVVLGHEDELEKALSNTRIKSTDFGRDQHFFEILLAVFSCLRKEEKISNVDSLIERLEYSSGSLVQSIPVLANIKTLIQKFLLLCLGKNTQITKELLFNLTDSAWAQWLCLRLWIANTSISEVAEVLTSEEKISNFHLALIWEEITWIQDFSAIVSSSSLLIITKKITKLMEDSQIPGSPIGQKLVNLRKDLINFSSSITKQKITDSELSAQSILCTWWSKDEPLQQLAQKEGKIELSYLEGRCALRQRSPDKALERFNWARNLCGENTVTNFLTHLRFVPILNYWQGVTLAHLERWNEAKEKLQLCLESPKKVEALAQLGLIALKENNIEKADEYLKQILNSQTPISALYLAALLAEQKGKNEEMHRRITQIEEIDISNTSIYSIANYRLQGALGERKGNYVVAAEKYRQALFYCPVDYVAAARLARTWLRENYHRVQNGQILISEPLSKKHWSVIKQIKWAEKLPMLRDCLALGSDKIDSSTQLIFPADLLQSQGRNALRRLALRSLLTVGQVETVRRYLQIWLDKDSANPYLVAVETILELSRNLKIFCQNSNKSALEIKDSQTKLEELVARIAKLSLQLPSDPAIEFWHDLTKVILNPILSETEELFVSILTERTISEEQRSLAAVINLFSENLEQRKQAAILCQQFLDNGFFADEKIKKAIACLVACLNGSDQKFLESYRDVESDLSALPCEEAQLYLVACKARLRMGEIDEVTDGIIPNSLAELDHPEVRRLIGLAYAQRAVGNARKNVRVALKDLEQASDLLGLDDISG